MEGESKVPQMWRLLGAKGENVKVHSHRVQENCTFGASSECYRYVQI